MDDLSTSLYKPAHQLVIYKSHHDYERRVYIEHHEIRNVSGQDVLSEGKPLTKKALRQIIGIGMASDKSTFATIKMLMPENILYYDPRPGRLKLIWYDKPQLRTLTGFQKRSPKVKLPAFVYYVDDDQLSIYAIKQRGRPNLKTPLFRAPLPNVYGDGRVCMGNVKRPQGIVELENLIQAWQTAFWGSEFTGFLIDDSDAKPLRAAIRSRRQFPASKLRPTKKTLNTLIA